VLPMVLLIATPVVLQSTLSVAVFVILRVPLPVMLPIVLPVMLPGAGGGAARGAQGGASDAVAGGLGRYPTLKSEALIKTSFTDSPSIIKLRSSALP